MNEKPEFTSDEITKIQTIFNEVADVLRNHTQKIEDIRLCKEAIEGIRHQIYKEVKQMLFMSIEHFADTLIEIEGKKND